MKKILTLLTLSTLALSANDSNSTLPDTWRISAGTYLTGKFSTDVDFDSKNGVSAGLNVQEIFDMTPTLANLYLDGYYRINPRHRIEIGYKGTRTGGSSTGAFTLFENMDNIPDVNITAGANSHFNTSTLSLAYTYSFYHTPKLEAGITIGLHYTMFNVGFQANIEDVGDEFGFALSQAIPMIGTRFQYNIYPEWAVLYSFDIFTLSAGLKLTQNEDGSIPQYLVDHFTGFSGYMSDFTLGTEYRIVDNFSIGAAFNYHIMDFSMELDGNYDIGVDSTVMGAEVYGSLHF